MNRHWQPRNASDRMAGRVKAPTTVWEYYEWRIGAGCAAGVEMVDRPQQVDCCHLPAIDNVRFRCTVDKTRRHNPMPYLTAPPCQASCRPRLQGVCPLAPARRPSSLPGKCPPCLVYGTFLSGRYKLDKVLFRLSWKSCAAAASTPAARPPSATPTASTLPMRWTANSHSAGIARGRP